MSRTPTVSGGLSPTDCTRNFELMDVEGVSLVGVIDERPFLDVAELHLDVDAVHRELLAVEIELSPGGVLGIDNPPLPRDRKRGDLRCRRSSLLDRYWRVELGTNIGVVDGLALDLECGKHDIWVGVAGFPGFDLAGAERIAPRCADLDGDLRSR